VEEAISRLWRFTPDIVLTDLPLARIRCLSQPQFLFFRSILVPSCRLSLVHVLERAEQVNTGLAELSTAHGVQFFRLNPAWYAFDPIHIRRSAWRTAWQSILGLGAAVEPEGQSVMEGLRCALMPPERQWLLGFESFIPQSGIVLPAGGRIWLY
jgi:hypothetical protein